MTKNDTDFDNWFNLLQMNLAEDDISFEDRDAAKEDYDAGKDLWDVIEEIKLEYE